MLSSAMVCLQSTLSLKLHNFWISRCHILFVGCSHCSRYFANHPPLASMICIANLTNIIIYYSVSPGSVAPVHILILAYWSTTSVVVYPASTELILHSEQHKRRTFFLHGGVTITCP